MDRCAIALDPIFTSSCQVYENTHLSPTVRVGHTTHTLVIDTFELEYLRSNTPYHERQLHLTTLPHPNHSAPQTRHKVNIARHRHSNLPHRSEVVASPIAIPEPIHIETLID